LSRIHEGINQLEVGSQCQKPMSRPDQDGANVELDGSSAYKDEALEVEGEDRRRKVNNPEELPFWVHGRFTATIKAVYLVGSGTMIGPDLVHVSIIFTSEE
jgi:hypothetical protein